MYGHPNTVAHWKAAQQKLAARAARRAALRFYAAEVLRFFGACALAGIAIAVLFQVQP